MSTNQPEIKDDPMYRLLRNYMLSVDILVRTPEEVRRYEGLRFSLIYRALREGVTLYEREA